MHFFIGLTPFGREDKSGEQKGQGLSGDLVSRSRRERDVKPSRSFFGPSRLDFACSMDLWLVLYLFIFYPSSIQLFTCSAKTHISSISSVGLNTCSVKTGSESP